MFIPLLLIFSIEVKQTGVVIIFISYGNFLKSLWNLLLVSVAENCKLFIASINFVDSKSSFWWRDTSSKLKSKLEVKFSETYFFWWCLYRLIKTGWLISCHWSLSIPPENIEKPEVFWCFQGVSKETSGMMWVNKGVRG